MFGYVKPFIPNLRVKDYELYKSVYCGLCRSMKSHTGGISRLTLSFDMTFFAMVRLALAKEDYNIRKRRCALHPIRKRPMMDDNETLAYTSYVSALLSFYKLADTVSDEKGLKRMAARCAMPYAGRMKKRACRAGEEPHLIIANAMETLAKLEKEACSVPDMPADVFGDMLGKLLAFGFEGATAKIAHEIGLHTGRWVYLTDAVFDYDEDKKSGSYNPFLFAFAEDAQMVAFREQTLRAIMIRETDAIARALALVDFEGRKSLFDCIENIIYDGMESALSPAVRKELKDVERSI